MQILIERYLHAITLWILASSRVSINSTKLKRDAKRGDKCSFPHHKVDEQPNKKPKKGYSSHKRKRRQECCGYGENCTTLGLRLARFGSIGFSKEKRPRGNPMQKVLGSSRKGRFTQSTLRKASVPENIEPSLGKIHQRYEIWGPVTWRDRENSDVPEAKHGTLPKKTFTKLKEKVKAKFCSHAEEWVLPNASSKRAERKRVRGGFRSEYAYGQQARPLLGWVGDHEDIEESYDGDDGQRRGANKRRSHCKCQRIGLIRDGYVSRRNSRSSFSREALRGSWVYISLDQRSETTSHQKWHENWLQKFKLCTIRSPWIIDEFLHNAHASLLHHLHHKILYLTSSGTPKIQYPKEVEVRVRSYGETRCIKPTQTENKNQNERREEVQSDLLHDLLDWLQEFRENLVDERSPLQPRRNPEPGYRDSSRSSHG